MSQILGQSVLIAGFGREGQSALNFIKNCYPNINVAVADQNPLQVKHLDIPTFSGKNFLSKALKFDTVIRSAGISKTIFPLSIHPNVTSTTNIFFENCSGKIIGITGTKGKSTTSSLIYQILKNARFDVRLAGNIGYPAIDFIKESNSNTWFVVELSSYQLDDIKYSPKIAVVLPIYQEHLNYHGSFNNYVRAKKNIVLFQKSQDFVIYDETNQYSKNIAKASLGKNFSINNKKVYPFAVWIQENDIWIQNHRNKEKLLSISNIPLIGDANLKNIMFSVMTALILNIDSDYIRKAILSFKPLEHRLEFCGKYHGIYFYNDSLATIPEATIHAIQSLGHKCETLITGGFDRGVDYSYLGKVIVNSSIKNLILFPTTGEKIQNAIFAVDKNTKIKINTTTLMEEAVKRAYDLTSNNKICLLSPASASFNLFKNYDDRGKQFKFWVTKLGKKSDPKT